MFIEIVEIISGIGIMLSLIGMAMIVSAFIDIGDTDRRMAYGVILGIVGIMPYFLMQTIYLLLDLFKVS